MGLAGKYVALINEIVVQLKTITPELADDIEAKGGARVYKWKSSRTVTKGRYEVEVRAGPMTILGGETTKSTNNEFVILVDLIFYGTEFEAAFDSCMGVAERIYDKVHLTTLNANCRITTVEIFPGDGQLSGRALLAVPIRLTFTCERVISQT